LAPSVHGAGDLAGTWTYLQVQTCSRTTANAAICNALLGPGGITSFSNDFRARCDAIGKCQYESFFTATADVEGSTPLCDPSIFTAPFEGTCLETEHGTAVLKGPPSATGLRDIFITNEYANFYGNPPLLNMHDPAGAANYPLDIAVPAVAGTYDTERYLTLLGLLQPGQAPPAGVFNLLIVRHEDSN
jgi:hypothetical protein